MYQVPGKAQLWHEIKDERRVLIIAEPGAGKTFEAMTRARKIRDSGFKAFFIRIESIDTAFENAFEVGNSSEFQSWLTSDQKAWFFLDSVDEAQIETPRALENAVRIFSDRIYTARERAHIFITSREDAWQALPDQSLIEQYLPCSAPTEAEGGEVVNRLAESVLKIFRLTGLSKDQIALFAGHHGVDDVPAFLDAIRRGNLMKLAERPFDLKALIQNWHADFTLGSRFEVLQKMIAIQLEPLSDSRTMTPIAPARARAGARALAGAVMLTGKSMICLSEGKHAPDRIDPREMLPDWTATEIDTLLKTGIFDDVVYTSVRFRHREVRELLSAEWASVLLALPSRRASIEHLFFRENYGEQIIVPRMRPTLAWLILLDEVVRDKVLALAPEIASEGGDPSRLPLAIRRTMLTNIVERIASGKGY